MDDLSLKGIAPKRSQSWGIANLETKPQDWSFNENHQIRELSTGLEGKVTKKRGTRSSCVTPTPNPEKKLLQNSATKIPRKVSENHQKGKTGETTKALTNHAETSIHTMKVHTRSSF
jgi:hypothetical protein